MGRERECGEHTKEVPAPCHPVQETHPESGVVMRTVRRAVSVDMLVERVVMGVPVDMYLNSPSSRHRPDADADEEEPDEELGPSGPRFDIDESAQYQPDATDDGNPDAVAKAPEHAGSRRS